MTALELIAPATSANLGPGYDAFGLALDRSNRYLVRTQSRGGLRFEGMPEGFSRGRDNAFIAALDAAMAERGAPPPEHLAITMELAIPAARGLGSSATARVAGAVAGALLAGDERPSRPAIARLASALEGHPDNAAACIFGGFVLCYRGFDGAPAFRRFEVEAPGLVLALCVPRAIETKTEAARAALPRQVPHADAAANVARAALVAAAFASGRFGQLPPEALEDALHEPTRAAAIPGFDDIRRRVRESGALGLTISGSGPSLLLWARDEASQRTALTAAAEAWRRYGHDFDAAPVAIDNQGCRWRRME